MGVNLVIVCHEHRVYGYSMRGEEGADAQWWMRAHGDCFKNRKISVYRDQDGFPREEQGFTPAWEHEERPAVRRSNR